MIPLKLSDIAASLDLAPPQRDLVIDAIVTDSRNVRYGCLFAALPGSRVNGLDFAPAAVATGAVALLVDQPVDLPVPQLLVSDVLAALGRIAAELRRRSVARVVGITGSNGKTTVKEMLSSILRQQANVLVTQGNYNNELGVPLTLFRLELEDRYAVVEMGASKAGDIAYLAAIAQPEVGLITNIGPAHLQGFGTMQGVARAKGELYAALPGDGCAVLNGDEPWCAPWRAVNTAGRVLTFGCGSGADIRFEPHGELTRLYTPAGSFDAALPLPGTHNRANAAAATAAALALDIPLTQIRSGLERVLPIAGRLNRIRTVAGWTVIDDTYNANPASLYSALQVVSGMPGTAWLVLGDMKELGEDSRKLHLEVGDAARALGVKKIFAIGEMSSATVDAFGPGAQHFATQQDLVAALGAALRPGINCLVKGSRSMGMERVVASITAAPPTGEAR